MRTDIQDIEQAVREMMDRVYVKGVAVDYVTQIIESNPPREADAVALYLGDTERAWDIVGQRFYDGEAPDVWLSFAILVDEPGRGTIGVFSHDAADGYADVVDYIEIDTRGAADELAAGMTEVDQLYAGVYGATRDYIERVMVDGKAA
mgnify:CR=1 FL=1